MNFSRGRKREEPEINFIPLIDLLLVILIFLMVTTTYNRFAELKINLPTASADAPQEKPLEIRVAVNPAGELYDGSALKGGSLRVIDAREKTSRAETELSRNNIAHRRRVRVRV